MLRPAKVECDDFAFFYPDVREGKKEGNNWKEAQVLHSVWQAPSGELGYVLVNYTSKPADFTLQLADYNILKGPCKMLMHRPGKRTSLHRDFILPSSKALQLAPREIMLIELLPEKGN